MPVVNRSVLIRHFLLWALFLSLPVIFISGEPNNAKLWPVVFSIHFFIFFLTYIVIFYFNAYFLVPRFYLQNRLFIYIIAVLILAIAVNYIRPFDNLLSMNRANAVREKITGGQPSPFENGPALFRKPPSGQPPGPGPGPGPGRFHVIDTLSIYLFLMMMGLSTSISITKRYTETEQRAARAEADKATAELSFLKAQINPHFLFNTLNNIYSLAIAKSENTADSIMRLSNIMRYITDESAGDFVPLQEEVNFIEDYIALQRMRVGEKTNIQFEVTGKLSQHKIAPLILMPFVENVFKYGISKREECAIIIQLHSRPDSMRFFCQNKIQPSADRDLRKGIGISNTRKRLDQIYKDRYELKIQSDQELFTVLLNLET